MTKVRCVKPVNPEDVVHPKPQVREVNVLINKGIGSFSIATLMWNNSLRIAIRWNGDNESIGQPQSCGYPTWFIIPKEIALSYAESIGNIEMKTIMERVEE